MYELEYFLLQLEFARRAGIVCHLSFEAAAIHFTSFVRQFRNRGCVWRSEWDFDTPPGVVAWPFFDLHRRDQLVVSPNATRFGPFNFWHDSNGASLRMRFVNGPRVLASTQQAQRVDELRSMFSFLAKNYDGDTLVTGFSWLYNLEAYSRLFPTAFIESAQSVPRWFSGFGRLDRGSVARRTSIPRPTQPSVPGPPVAEVAPRRTLARRMLQTTPRDHGSNT
jgi:hypothetical protein